MRFYMSLTSSTKYTLLTIIMLIFNPTITSAGCGSCQTDHHTPNVTASNIEKSNALITSIPKSGKVEGFAIASCGMCNFDYRKIKGCNLTIKIEDKVYPVEGSGMHDHGDPHGSEGFCFAVRVAYVSGKIKKGKFYSDSFALIESPK